MPARVVALLVLTLLLGAVAPVLAHDEPRAARAAATTGTTRVTTGVIQGTVRDDAGRAVAGALIVALGPTLLSARSDVTGRFLLTAPPGDYVLRATREGYVSTYREAVKVQISGTLERHIRLARQLVSADGVALVATAGEGEISSTAWRLRNLPLTVLRDRGRTGQSDAGFEPDGSSRPPRTSRASIGAPRAAWDDFNGQLNYFATGRLTSLPSASTSRTASRVADLSFGAPVGSAGAWAVRGVMDATNLSSWAVRGEFQSRDDLAHVFTVGVSYSAQSLVAAAATGPRSLAPGQIRSVGSGYGFDRWRIAPRLEIDYGLRVDRYDYLATRHLPSARLGIQVEPIARTFVRLHAAQRFMAPGADEFFAPDARGEWLPSTITFAPLRGEVFRAQRVTHFEATIGRRFGSADRARTISVRRFNESTRDQIAAVFGVSRRQGGSQYVVLTPGSVSVEGWGVQVAGRLLPYVRGRVDYAVSDAAWRPGPLATRIARVATSVVRPPSEKLHDVTAVIDATLPGTSTDVAVAYRVNSGFSRGRAQTEPDSAGRFDIHVYHALHYQPIHGGRLEVLFALRTLYRDVEQAGSVYDELLTVAPPMRLMAGVRVKF